MLHTRRFAAATGIAAALAAATLSAQTPAPAQPPARTAAAALPGARAIIDRHIAAIGGREALANRTSTRAAGTISIASAGITGSIEIVAARPGKFVHRVTLPGIGETQEGYNGAVAWSINPMTGPRVLSGGELEQRRADADFDADLHPDSRYQSMTTVEKTTFDGRDVYKLRLVLKDGREETEYYDVATGLRAGVVRTDQSPMGPITSTVTEREYRKFGPLLQPTSMTLAAMGIEQQVTFSSFEFDTVKDAEFAPPPAIAALVK